MAVQRHGHGIEHLQGDGLLVPVVDAVAALHGALGGALHQPAVARVFAHGFGADAHALIAPKRQALARELLTVELALAYQGAVAVQRHVGVGPNACGQAPLRHQVGGFFLRGYHACEQLGLQQVLLQGEGQARAARGQVNTLGQLKAGGVGAVEHGGLEAGRAGVVAAGLEQRGLGGGRQPGHGGSCGGRGGWHSGRKV